MTRTAYLLALAALAGGVFFAAYILFLHQYEYEVVVTSQNASGEVSRTVEESGTMRGIRYIREADNYAVAVWALVVIALPAIAVYAARRERTFLVWWTAITLMILGFTVSKAFALGFGLQAALLLASAFLLQMSHRRPVTPEGA